MSLESVKSMEKIRFRLIPNRRNVWTFSCLLVLVSLIGLLISWLNPSIGYPLRPGLDFTGGTQIKVDRICQDKCSPLEDLKITQVLSELDLVNEDNSQKVNLSGSRVQLLDRGRSLIVRTPYLNPSQATTVINSIQPFVGLYKKGSQSVDTIGPTLGAQLLLSSLISLIVAFSGIALYISIRYDKTFALLALVALSHDIVIVCGVFAWLGIFFSVEVDSLFAVSLLTIAGYSVNDTVVVFDRIREQRSNKNLDSISLKIDKAVSETFTRTIYTSCSTLLPLIALIFFGGSTLYWFSISLAIGVVVGSWSSIALAPSLLSLREPFPTIKSAEEKSEGFKEG